MNSTDHSSLKGIARHSLKVGDKVKCVWEKYIEGVVIGFERDIDGSWVVIRSISGGTHYVRSYDLEKSLK